jgi:cytochrome c553
MKSTHLVKTLLASAALLVAATSTTRAAELQENWTKNCGSCHGKDGRGQTKAGRMAEVKDLTDAAVQSAFTDEQAFNQIKGGLKDKSGEKFRMKPFSDKLTDEEIKALVAHVRTLKK